MRKKIVCFTLVMFILLLANILISYIPELFQKYRMIIVAEKIKHAEKFVVIDDLNRYPYIKNAIVKGKVLIPKDDETTVRFLVLLSNNSTNVIKVDGYYYRIILIGLNKSNLRVKTLYLPLR